MVESQPSKLLVAGSIPVSRSNLRSRGIGTRASVGKPPKVVRRRVGEGGRCVRYADVAQSAERVLGKDEVTSSILVIGSRLNKRQTSFFNASNAREETACRKKNLIARNRT